MIREWIQATGPWISGLGICIGFVLTLIQLRRNKRAQSLTAMTAVYQQFYQTDKLDKNARVDFEYNFFDKFAPVMEKSLVYERRLDADQKNILAEVDALLNFLEHIAHLSRRGKILAGADADAMFHFWFQLMKEKPTHIVLERYLLEGFECLQDRIQIKKQPVLLAVYGTLMLGEDNTLSPPDLLEKIKSLGECEIPGVLFDTNKGYPGLSLPSPAMDSVPSVRGELFQIADNDESAAPILAALDKYEEFDPDTPEKSLFVRRYVRLLKPKRGAWLYVIRDSKNLAEIESGDWKEHRQKIS